MATQDPSVLRRRFERKKLGISGRIAAGFLNNKLTPLLVVFALFLGAMAVMVTPREEEPQISVPMVDIFVQYPGGSAAEVEQLVATPMEKLLWEISAVDYVYTTSMPSGAMAIVRFDVGEDPETSLVKVYNKMYGNMERIPVGVSQPLIKLRTIDDVPIMAVTLHSKEYGPFELRRVAEEVATELKKVRRREPDPGDRRRAAPGAHRPGSRRGLAGYTDLAAAGLPGDLAQVQRQPARPAGSTRATPTSWWRWVTFSARADEVGRTVVAVYGGNRPVFLRRRGDHRPMARRRSTTYVLPQRRAPGSDHVHRGRRDNGDWPLADEAAVTIALAKRPRRQRRRFSPRSCIDRDRTRWKGTRPGLGDRLRRSPATTARRPRRSPTS